MDKHAHIVQGIFPPPHLFPYDRTHLSSIISASPTSRLCEINRISVDDAQRNSVSRIFTSRHMFLSTAVHHQVSKYLDLGKIVKNVRSRARKINNMHRGKRKVCKTNATKNLQNLNK